MSETLVPTTVEEIIVAVQSVVLPLLDTDRDHDVTMTTSTEYLAARPTAMFLPAEGAAIRGQDHDRGHARRPARGLGPAADPVLRTTVDRSLAPARDPVRLPDDGFGANDLDPGVGRDHVHHRGAETIPLTGVELLQDDDASAGDLLRLHRRSPIAHVRQVIGIPSLQHVMMILWHVKVRRRRNCALVEALRSTAGRRRRGSDLQTVVARRDVRVARASIVRARVTDHELLVRNVCINDDTTKNSIAPRICDYHTLLIHCFFSPIDQSILTIVPVS